METATVVQREKVQVQPIPKAERIDLFRWQKYADGDGKLWVVTNLFGHDNAGRYGANVELLDIDNERTVDVPRKEVEGWVKVGTLKRIELPILL
jgi:hypothetical protein